MGAAARIGEPVGITREPGNASCNTNDENATDRKKKKDLDHYEGPDYYESTPLGFFFEFDNIPVTYHNQTSCALKAHMG
jgi:hypothetical protein